MALEELIKYVEQNHLEYQMVSILMFNDYAFSFLPVVEPRIYFNSKVMTVEIIGFDGINLFSNEYKVPQFNLPQEIANSNRINRLLNHPEHLHAYIIRQNDNVYVEVLYSRKTDGAKIIREAAFESFATLNNIETVEQFNRLYSRSEIIQKNNYRRGVGRGVGTCDYLHLVEDNALISSLKLAGENWNRVRMTFAVRMYSAWRDIFGNRFSVSETSMQFTGITFFLSAKFAAIKPIKTPLNKSIAIIDSDDDISNILYRIAYDIRANMLYIATGYMYESGLNHLLPVFYSINTRVEHRVELIIGDLYKYAKGLKFKSPNRATASFLNMLNNAHIVTSMYTYLSRFYHGKFYYISNGTISYVIMGSSNVTQSAFQKNKEFDIIYRFDKNEEQNHLESEFIEWYNSLKNGCLELSELDESMFPSNLSIDEDGTSCGNAILRTIKQDEERQRFKFLESFSPSQVETGVFKGKNYRPFKDYMLFIYPERGLSIMEGFSYGKACYIFSSIDIKKIKQELIGKSKDEIKRSEFFIADVVHDEHYRNTVENLLARTI